jgi:signal transduction histidine kinase
MRTRRRESSSATGSSAGPAVHSAASGPGAGGSRWNLTRTWSLRRKIIVLFTAPLVTVLMMWTLATWVTLRPGLALLDAQTTVDNVGRPAQALIAALQDERKLSFSYVASGREDDRELTEQVRRTDQAVADFRARADTDETRSALVDEGRHRLTELLLHLDALPELRDDIEAGGLDRATTLRRYGQIIDASFSLTSSLIRLSTEDLVREAQALVTLAQAREVLAQEDAIISGAIVAGRFPAEDLSAAVQLIGAARHQFDVASRDLHVSDRVAYEQVAATEAAATLASLENRVVAEARAGEAPPLAGSAWRDAYDEVTADLLELELAAADRLVERGRPEATFILLRIAVTGLFGLIATLATAWASLRVGRSLLRRLAGLRQAALELSLVRLPSVVERLRQGERVDVAAEAPPMPYGEDELGQVGRAFNSLQRTAIGAAVAEADLRRGVNDVFLNIARRSQTLLHRQLSILDRMERRTEDPVELEDLFRVDHLATRMRRHAEDLVILAGAAPGRGWRNPVPVVDVLRGAISEVEDYARVTVRPVPEVAVTGRAVGDVIHLLAELIENATVFSPPHTKVTIGAEPVTNGLAIEIEDRGLGMPPATLAEINARLTNPPEFDPGRGAQLGLFVVARLAARHGISVQLRRSAYGGTSAVALLPDALMALPGEQAALPAGISTEPPPGGGFVELTSGSPRAPRSEPSSSPAVGFTPIAAAGEPLPTRRGQPTPPAEAEQPDGEPVDGSPRDDPSVIIATTGKPMGRHARREVIDPADDVDGLPQRVRQTPAPRLHSDGTLARGSHNDSGDVPDVVEIATHPVDTRSPEQIRAMMSSFQDGMARARQETDAPIAGGIEGVSGGEAADTVTAGDAAEGGRAGSARVGRGRTGGARTDDDGTGSGTDGGRANSGPDGGHAPGGETVEAT